MRNNTRKKIIRMFAAVCIVILLAGSMATVPASAQRGTAVNWKRKSNYYNKDDGYLNSSSSVFSFMDLALR